MTDVTKQLSPRLIASLERQRDALNQAFAFAQHIQPQLDADEFGPSFCELAEAVLAVLPADIAETNLDDLVVALFQQSLRLSGAGFMGAGTARAPGFLAGWKKLLRELPAFVLADPLRNSAACGNSLLRLLQTPGAKTKFWLEQWCALGEQWFSQNASVTPDPELCEDFRRAGVMLAWRAGLSLFRETALNAAADCTRSEHALLALGVGSGDDGLLQNILIHLRANPWRSIENAATLARGETLQAKPVLRRLGGFAGFDGLFEQPPTIWNTPGGPAFEDRNQLYSLNADIYGHNFRRITEDELLTRAESQPAADASNRSGLRLEDGVVITADQKRFSAPQLANANGFAAYAGHSLYVTKPGSHQIFVIGFPAA